MVLPQSLCYQNTNLLVFCLPVGKDGGGCWQPVKGKAGGHLSGGTADCEAGLGLYAESESKGVRV